MESGPAIFAGTVFSLFGAALLLGAVTGAVLRATPVWRSERRHRATVALAGVVSLATGTWCLLYN